MTKSYIVDLNIYRYFILEFIEKYIVEAKNKKEAKQKIIKDVSSAKWAPNLTVIPDLRTIKLIKD